MTTHLRRHIEAGKLLFPEQLNHALRRQEIYGGSLDTALLELEFVDAPTLAHWLHDACGLGNAPPELLSRRSDRPWDAVDVELMRLSWAIPLAREGGRLQVAVHPDLPDDRLKGLYASLANFEPLVAPECCMEALHAEWLGSVLSQRYAVLSVGYISALRRAASTSSPPVPATATVPSPGPTQPAETQPDRQQRGNATLRYRWNDGGPTEVEEVSTPSEAPAVSQWRAPTQASAPETAIDLPLDRRPPSREETAVGPAPTAPTPVSGSIDTSPPPRRGTGRAGPPRPDSIPSDGPQAEPDQLLDGKQVVEVPVDRAARPRFTPQGTLIDDGRPVGRFDEGDLIRRMAGARSVLQTTRSRDAAMEAVVTASMVISPRVAVFRIRGAELVGLSTPRSELADVGGKVVPMDEGTPIATAVADASFSGRLEDPDLALALQLEDAPPCALRRIDVLGRAVLVLYLDNPTREFLPAEFEQLDALCEDASEAFAAIIKLRRNKNEPQRPAPARDASGPAALGTGPHESWAKPSSRLRAAYGHDDDDNDDDDDDVVVVRASRPAEERVPQFDPTTFEDDDSVAGSTAPPGPTPHEDDVASADGNVASAATTDVATDRPVHADGPTVPIEGESGDNPDARTTKELAPGLEIARVTDPPAAAAENPTSRRDTDSARLTVHSAPPPPPLPPPPVRFDLTRPPDETASRSAPSTLTGLPPLGADERDVDDGPPVPVLDRQIPDRQPPEGRLPRNLALPGDLGDEPDELDIISLASPIDQPTVRGRIKLEAEDWAGPRNDADQSARARIEAEVMALAAGEGEIRRLIVDGDAALAALASQLPGPLEVLRRDLRALPPPAAHGPLIRAAIAAGPPMVPHLLELLHHPNPDIRFYAAYIFQELRDDRCAATLCALAFDVSGDVRVIAMRVLETYSRAEQFAFASESVRARLDSSDRTERLYAARAVGTLRDVQAVHELIELLASKDRFIQEAAIESLCSITGQQLGLKPHRWKSWYADNRQQHRIEWIIESLRHKDLPVRQWAAHELSRITGHRIAFSPLADKRARDTAVRAWTDWWNAAGKSRMGANRA